MPEGTFQSAQFLKFYKKKYYIEENYICICNICRSLDS